MTDEEIVDANMRHYRQNDPATSVCPDPSVGPSNSNCSDSSISPAYSIHLASSLGPAPSNGSASSIGSGNSIGHVLAVHIKQEPITTDYPSPHQNIPETDASSRHPNDDLGPDDNSEQNGEHEINDLLKSCTKLTRFFARNLEDEDSLHSIEYVALIRRQLNSMK